MHGRYLKNVLWRRADGRGAGGGACRVAGAGDYAGVQGVRDSVAMLGLMVLWRFVEPFFYL